MKVTAYLLAFFDDIQTRVIDIPADAIEAKLDFEAGIDVWTPQLLELAWYYGQNDFQPQQVRSLSAGDVVVLNDGSKHRVRMAGWEQIADDVAIESLERGSAAALLF